MSSAAVTIAPERRTTGDPRLDDEAANFEAMRRRLVGIAHRILGCWTEAEDIVQDAWLRWQCYDRQSVANPTAFLVTTTTRLAINAAQSARARRESYVGQWLFEPIAAGDDPAAGAEHNDDLRLGILLLLERLAPAERAAYVLHEAFDYPYPKIAEIVQTNDVNARQIVSRARKHLANAGRWPASCERHRRLLRAFVAAARQGALGDLEKLLADEVVTHPSGGRPRSAPTVR